MALKIIKTGVRSLIQDRGRFGYHRIGLGVSGAIDEVSFLVGQYLLENIKTKNAIEILLGGLIAEVQKDANFSITGANSMVFKNNEKIPMWSSFFAKKGDIIEIGKVQEGSINYLAVEGGFELEKFCDSYATNFKLGIGANDGKKLGKQVLIYRKTAPKYKRLFQKKYLPAYWQKIPKTPTKIALVPFPNAKDYFSREDIENFFQSNYKIGLQSDRIGIRLETNPIQPKKLLLFSEPLSYGTVQIQNSGVPIILMKDCQTIGGYPKIGYISALDCFWLSQMRPAQEIIFIKDTAENSQQKLQEFYRKFLF